jgi:chemotaxis family two-component system response regulator PixH
MSGKDGDRTTKTIALTYLKIMGTALVIDDSFTEMQILCAYLQQIGIKVSTASSGEEALEKIDRERPNIILLDVVLPGRSGFEICRELKTETKTSKIPIIMCSTKGTDIDKFWGLKQGADAYLTKPIDPEELVRTVRGLIEA